MVFKLDIVKDNNNNMWLSVVADEKRHATVVFNDTLINTIKTTLASNNIVGLHLKHLRNTEVLHVLSAISAANYQHKIQNLSIDDVFANVLPVITQFQNLFSPDLRAEYCLDLSTKTMQQNISKFNKKMANFPNALMQFSQNNNVNAEPGNTTNNTNEPQNNNNTLSQNNNVNTQPSNTINIPDEKKNNNNTISAQMHEHFGREQEWGNKLKQTLQEYTSQLNSQNSFLNANILSKVNAYTNLANAAGTPFSVIIVANAILNDNDENLKKAVITKFAFPDQEHSFTKTMLRYSAGTDTHPSEINGLLIKIVNYTKNPDNISFQDIHSHFINLDNDFEVASINKMIRDDNNKRKFGV